MSACVCWLSSFALSHVDDVPPLLIMTAIQFWEVVSRIEGTGN
jgi:hypothetical protein